MNKIVSIVCISLILSGCANMTPGEKKTAWIIAGIVVAGVALSKDSSADVEECVDTIGFPNSSGVHIVGCP